MEENEGASPQEQLAAEVAADTSETGEVTADDVAEVLHLPKRAASSNENEDDTAEEKAETDAEDESTGDDEEADDDSEAEADADEEDDTGEEEATNTDEKQFVLKFADVNGKEYTLTPDDDIEAVLEDFEPKSNGQIFKILRDFQKLETAKEQYESEQEEESKQAEYKKQVSSIRAGWDKEVTALQGEKRIPVEADGKIPARVTEVFKYMREQNDKRLQDGRPLLNSFEDALDKLELKESKDDAIEKNKKDKELARKRGAVVGGSSAPASSGVSTYKRGSARTATEALKMQGIL